MMWGRVAASVINLGIIVPLVLASEFPDWFARQEAGTQVLVLVYGTLLFIALQWFIMGVGLRWEMRSARRRRLRAAEKS